MGRAPQIHERVRVGTTEFREVWYDPKRTKAFSDSAPDHSSPRQLMIELSSHGEAGALHLLCGCQNRTPLTGERNTIWKAIK
jgi:hypothetical protein